MTRSALVAGVDSSTQSCKVVVRDATTGALVRSGRATHPDGTEVHPHHWWDSLQQAVAEAGGLDDVAAVAVGGQQHGMVALDEDGEVVRDALLWNDTRSARAAADLVAELGDGDVGVGAARWAEAVGSVPVASLATPKAAARPGLRPSTDPSAASMSWAYRLRPATIIRSSSRPQTNSSPSSTNPRSREPYQPSLSRSAVRPGWRK